MRGSLGPRCQTRPPLSVTRDLRPDGAPVSATHDVTERHATARAGKSERFGAWPLARAAASAEAAC